MEAIQSERTAAALFIRLDTGKLNVLGLEHVRALRRSVTAAAADPELRVLVISGRADAFSAGLDLAVLAAGELAAGELLLEMGELLYDLYRSRLRVVCGCRGHAVAAGAMLLLVSDTRIGTTGSFRVGFSEVTRGLPLPEIAVLLARDRLSPRVLAAATLLGRLFEPAAAVDAGFLDETVAATELESRLSREADTLGHVGDEAYAKTLAHLRGPSLQRMGEILQSERERVTRLRAVNS